MCINELGIDMTELKPISWLFCVFLTYPILRMTCSDHPLRLAFQKKKERGKNYGKSLDKIRLIEE